MIEYKIAPSLPLIKKKKKKFYGNYLKMASAHLNFKRWMDTLLSFIPMRGFLVDRSKSYYRFLAKQLMKSLIASDEVGVGKQQYDSKFQHQSQELYKCETRGIILYYGSRVYMFRYLDESLYFALGPPTVLSFYQWLGGRQDMKTYQICRWHRAGRNH